MYHAARATGTRFGEGSPASTNPRMGPMKHTSLLLRAGILTSITTIALAASCTAKNAQPTSGAEKPIPLLAGAEPSKPVLNTLDRTDETDSTDALARTTASYADQMEQMLAARAAEVAQLKDDESPLVQTPAPVPVANVPPREPASAPMVGPAPSEVAFADPSTLPPVVDPQPEAPPASVRTIARTDATQTRAPVPLAPPPQQPDEAELAANIDPQLNADNALERKFAQRVKDYPRDVAAHFDFQLFQFLQDKSVPDLNTIAALPVEDREMVTALLDGLSNFRNVVRADNNTLLSKKIAPIVEMADRMRAQADLSIPTAALCTRVEQFGVYTPVAATRFVSGAPNEVILYCEVANFASHLNGKGAWETKLKYTTALYTDNEAGMPVWQGNDTPITDECRNRRRDFFLADKITLPANLPIGGYLMKVSIVDLHANRIAEATVPLQVVAR